MDPRLHTPHLPTRAMPSNTRTVTSIRKPCRVHPLKELEFFCEQCRQPICLNCKLTKHQPHETKDLSACTAAAKGQLLKEGERLKGQIASAKKDADLAENELNAVKEKQRALRQFIEDRYYSMLCEINKYRENALASLDNVTEEILAVQKVEVNSRKEKVDKLKRLQNRVQLAADSGNLDKMWSVGTEVCGLESGLEEDFLQKLTTERSVPVVSRPVLYCNLAKPTNAVLQPVQDFIGNTVIKRELPVAAPEVVLEEFFDRCPWPVIQNTDVCHLCPMTDGTVWVSFKSVDKSGESSEASEKFRADGALDHSQSRVYGQTARMGIRGGTSLDIKPSAGTTFVFAKRQDSHLTRFLGLRSNLTGQATVEEIIVESVKPLTTIRGELCVVLCYTPRAFDVASNEQFLVVLEEGDGPDAQRTVRLYRPPQPDPIHAYNSPVRPFQPSDVCFYTLGGQEVLLVADELNDAIHVVNVSGQFAGYLAPGCPKLIKPTALNTDTRGRLWVGCRGGSILRSQI